MAQSNVQQLLSKSIRVGEMLKIKDANLKNDIDIVAVVAKVGKMKMATQSFRWPVPAREIYLCDDSWAMIQLIAMDLFAESSANFKPNQIIYIRNVKAMKLRGFTVLATMHNTLIDTEVNTYEALMLRSWLSENNVDFSKDENKELLLKRFINLSCTADNKNSSAGSPDNSHKELQSSQSSQIANTSPTTQINVVEENKNTPGTNGTMQRKRSHYEESVNGKFIKIDLKEDTATINEKEQSSSDVCTSISDCATQKVSSNASEKVTAVAKDIEIVSIDNDNKSEEKIIKTEILEKEDNDIEVTDDDKDFIVCETYNALISIHGPQEIWTEEKDKYLIHFITKHCKNQLTDDIYLKLYQANLDIFKDISVVELKNRVKFLANAKNYIYLLQLCGGKEIKNEKQKTLFIARVDELRRIMRSNKIKQ